MVSFDLSIIILNYNVKELLLSCLKSVFKNKQKEDNWQVIVVDNASTDGSVEEIKKQFPEVEVVVNKENLGFAKGNNSGIPKAKADVVLFLNPDTEIVGDVIQKSLETLGSDPKIGAVGCKVELPNGQIDYSSHRGFPTPWNAFAYFSKLSSYFPKSRVFSGYTASYLDNKTSHEIDCISGTFMMVRRKAGQEVGWWDSDYFWNGEDIEFCYSLKEKGWKIYYMAEGKIIHYKGSSSGLWSTAKHEVPKDTRIKAAKHAAEAMRIFYKKHFYKKYLPVLRDLVLFGISMLEKYRLAKIYTGMRYK